MCNVTSSESWIVTKRLPFLGIHILKISFNTAYILQKKHLFVQKSWGITTLSKQTRSFYVRIEIKTLVILRMLFAYMSPESIIRTHGYSRISILISVILNSLLRILSHVFYSSHSAYYVWLCSFLKAVWSGSVNNLNLRHLVRSNELRVNNESIHSSIQSACSGLNFSNRTESKQCENKWSSKQWKPSAY